jgi:hypothetical protein
MDFSCIYFITQLGRYIPGKIWMVLSKIKFLGDAGFSKPWVALVSVLEILLVMSSAAVFLGILSLLDPLNKNSYIPQSVMILIGVAGLIFLVGFRFLWKQTLNLLQRWIRRIRFDDISYPYKTGDIPLISMGFIFIWLIQGSAFYFLVSSVADPAENAIYIYSIYPIAWILGFLSIFAPSGFGVREGIIVFMLLQIMSPTEASCIAIAARLGIVVLELGVSLIFLPRFMALKAV